jgi:hypothetical protein
MGPPGCGKTHFAKKYFFSYLGFHKNTIFPICISNRSSKMSKPSKMKMDKILEMPGLKRKRPKLQQSNKSIKPKRKSGKNCPNNYVLLFFIQANHFLLLTLKKLTSELLIN